MDRQKKTKWESEHHFDRQSCRHYNDNIPYVLHCHHYSTLYTQLADDAEFVDGKSLLRRSCELTFFRVLNEYFQKNQINDCAERIALVEDYWRQCGMGTMHFERWGELSATVKMEHSHVDDGWIIKWGHRNTPVNFIGQGFLAAAMAAITGQPKGTFRVIETQSIVSGAEYSSFSIIHN